MKEIKQRNLNLGLKGFKLMKQNSICIFEYIFGYSFGHIEI